MTELQFRSTVDSTEDWRDQRSMRQRTVVLRFGRTGTGMFQIDHVSLGNALLEHVQVQDIVALGCLRGNHEWHVTLARAAAVDRLLEASSLAVEGPRGAVRHADMYHLIPQRVPVRVLWCPAWVPEEAIYEMMESIAPVASFEQCRAKLGEHAVRNLQYSVLLKNVWPSRVPDRVTLEIFGEKVPLLLITRGKPRSCFLCGSCSHTQASCPNPVCRYCNKRGHVVTNCPRKRQQEEARRAAGAGAPAPETASETVPVTAPETAPETVPAAATKTAPEMAPGTSGELTSVNMEQGGEQNDKKRHASGSDDDGQPVRKKDPTVIPETQVTSDVPEKDVPKEHVPEEVPPEEDLLSPLVIDATQ